MQLSIKAQAIAPSLTLGINALAISMRKEGKDVVGFGAGEPDFDTPEYIKNAAMDAIRGGKTKYTPASGITELKKAVCDRYLRKYNLAYEPEQVVVSSGAKHSLFNAFQAILNPGDEVIIPSPYWLTYPELVKMADGVPVLSKTEEENNFEPKPEDIKAAITDKTKAIIVNSPSNPCGCIYGEETLKSIAALAKEHDLYIISDEIYDELSYEKQTTSIAMVSEDAKNRTIVINGLSKAYAMTGWRMGFVIAPLPVAKVIASYQSHATSNPCSITQYAGVTALNGPQEDLTEMVKVFAKRSELMYGLINAIPGISALKSQGAFYVFANIKELIGKKYKGQLIAGSVEFTEILLKEKLVAVVPGKAFGDDGYIRLSYATSEENIMKGLARIAEFCEAITE